MADLYLFDALIQGYAFAGLPIEDRVDDLQQKRILILMGNDHIVTVEKVLPCGPCSCFQSGNHFRVVCLAVIERRLILKNHQESSSDSLPGSDRLDQIVIVLLEFPALGVMLVFHVSLNGVEVLTDVRLLCQNFDLHFDRADFEPAGKGRYNVLLLPDTAQEEVDGFHFQDLDVSAILHMDDAVTNITDRYQAVRKRFLFCAAIGAGFHRALLISFRTCVAPASTLHALVTFGQMMLLDFDAELLRRIMLLSSSMGVKSGLVWCRSAFHIRPV